MAAAAMTACWTGTSGESRRNISTSGAWSMNCSRRAALNLMWRGRGFRACKITCSGSLPQVSAVQDVKASLLLAVQGINRGIFGVPTPKKNEIEELLKTLESLNPSPKPTENLDKVKGEWRMLYSTISILGVKRTKLGLRDFISLGDFFQTIDVEQGRAINKICFGVAGLGMLSGALIIEASYVAASPSRVSIQFERSSITPKQLLSLFQKNYDILLEIFNPEGWLEITYVDDTLRVGRDDKGNVFLVERT